MVKKRSRCDPGVEKALPVWQVLAPNYKEFKNSNFEPRHLEDIFLTAGVQNLFYLTVCQLDL